jgi:hypothetical protein
VFVCVGNLAKATEDLEGALALAPDDKNVQTLLAQVCCCSPVLLFLFYFGTAFVSFFLCLQVKKETEAQEKASNSTLAKNLSKMFATKENPHQA